MKTMSLKLPDALATKLAALARRRKSSKSAVIRDALAAYFQNGNGPRDNAFVDLVGDLLGCLDSGVGDLSYNKKRLEGFGR